jgi:hypothetical protein
LKRVENVFIPVSHLHEECFLQELTSSRSLVISHPECIPNDQ